MAVVDIAVFAHDEEDNIAGMLESLLAQSVFSAPDFDVRLIVLANGCTDQTVAVARHAAGRRAEILELAEPGKSRTWHRFIHGEVRPWADVLVLADADIQLPEPGLVEGLVRHILLRPELVAISSLPVKDLARESRRLTLVERLILASAGTSDDWRTAICGQLYALRATVALGIPMPVGLPVEDGYLRAMILTDCFTGEEQFERIDGDPTLQHVYRSERTIGSLLRHQTRIVVGGAVNAAIYAWLREFPAEERKTALARAATEDGWLGRLLLERLPVWPYGWVPVSFLWKRTGRAMSAGQQALSPAMLLRIAMGLGFDTVVWVRAQVRMARGAEGHW